MTPPQGAGFLSEQYSLFVVLMLRLFPLFLNVFSDDLRGHLVPHRPNIVAISPKLSSPKLLFDLRKLPKYFPRRNAFHNLHYFSRCVSWRCSHKHMNVIPVCRHRINHPSISLTNPLYQLTKSLPNTCPIQQVFPILHDPHQVISDIPTSMRPAQCSAHPTTLPHLPPYLKGSPPQEAGFKRNEPTERI